MGAGAVLPICSYTAVRKLGSTKLAVMSIGDSLSGRGVLETISTLDAKAITVIMGIIPSTMHAIRSKGRTFFESFFRMGIILHILYFQLFNLIAFFTDSLVREVPQ